MQNEYLSPEKFEELKTELARLKNEERKKVAEQLEYAKSLGDLSENAEYHEARDNQAKTEARIAELETILKSAVIMSHEKSGDVVSAGSTITVKKNGTSDKRTFTIVGSEETDTAEGKISYHSPLGSAAMGKRKGDNFTVRTPNGEVEYTLVEIN